MEPQGVPPTIRGGQRPTPEVFATVLDQAFSTASNAVLVIGVASSVSADEFGDFALAYGIFAFALGIQRAGVGDPFLVREQHAGRPSGVDEARFLRNTLATAAASAALLALAGLVLPGTLGRYLLAFALASFFVLSQDGLRYLAMARHTPGLAAAMDALWFAVLAIGLWATVDIEGSGAVTTWTIGATLGLVLGVMLLRPAGLATIRRLAPSGGWLRTSFGLEFAALTLGGVSLLVGFRALLGPQAAGALAAIVSLFQPAQSLLAGLRLYYLPRLRRAFATDRYRAEIRLWSSVVVVVLVGWTVACLAAGRVLAVLLGDTWVEARPILLAGAVFQLCWGLAALRADHLKVAGAAHRLVLGRVLFTVVFLLGALLGAAFYDLAAAANGLAVGASLGLLGWLLLTEPMMRTGRRIDRAAETP